MFKRLFLGLLSLSLFFGAAASTTVDSITPRRKVAPMIVRIGSSAAINLALTEALKSSVHEMRPDRHDNHSWPSRHTSWAFTAASVLSHELYDRSAWWVVGSHTVANAVALQRTFSNRHFPKDILGGAAVGLVSTELGYFISGLIFPDSGPVLENATDEWLPSLDATTSAIFPLSGIGDGASVRTGCAAGLRFSIPCSDNWGFGANFSMNSLPIYVNGSYTSMLNSGGLSLGAVGHWSLPSARWGAEARLMPGIARNFGGKGVDVPGWSFTLDATSTATCAITPSFTIGAEAGYYLRTLRHTMNALTVSILTRIRF